LDGVKYLRKRLDGFVEFILVQNHFTPDFDNPGMAAQEKKYEGKYILRQHREPE
jgi:hypothetical protein